MKNRPYIICHMMTSIDGRIDCRMTEQLPGVEEYYDTLATLDTPVHVSGRVTAEIEMATGTFRCKESTPYNKEGWFAGRRGEGWYQEEGKPAVSLHERSVITIPANVKHWHGAKKDSWFSHIAVEVAGENCHNEWCEPVSDEDYDRL